MGEVEWKWLQSTAAPSLEEVTFPPEVALVPGSTTGRKAWPHCRCTGGVAVVWRMSSGGKKEGKEGACIRSSGCCTHANPYRLRLPSHLDVPQHAVHSGAGDHLLPRVQSALRQQGAEG